MKTTRGRNTGGKAHIATYGGVDPLIASSLGLKDLLRRLVYRRCLGRPWLLLLQCAPCRKLERRCRAYHRTIRDACCRLTYPCMQVSRCFIDSSRYLPSVHGARAKTMPGKFHSLHSIRVVPDCVAGTTSPAHERDEQETGEDRAAEEGEEGDAPPAPGACPNAPRTLFDLYTPRWVRGRGAGKVRAITLLQR
jgi:hypothetical protein